MTRRDTSMAVIAMIVASLPFMTLTGCNESAPQSESSTAGLQAKTRIETPPADENEGTGKGMDALRKASAGGKYLFTFFFKAEDGPTLAMRKVFDQAMEKMTDRAQWVAVNVTDASEKAIVAKFELGRAPMPLVLAIAPNGAVTGGFPTKFEEQQLLDAFASPATEKCVKSLQEGKLVLLCIQNEKTKSNDAAMKGVNDFKTDERFGNATTVITLDPTDKKETSFLNDLQVPAETTEAITVFLAPPGRPLAKYEGATSKDTLVDTLGKANTGCGPNGCGPAGCGPTK